MVLKFISLDPLPPLNSRLTWPIYYSTSPHGCLINKHLKFNILRHNFQTSPTCSFLQSSPYQVSHVISCQYYSYSTSKTLESSLTLLFFLHLTLNSPANPLGSNFKIHPQSNYFSLHLLLPLRSEQLPLFNCIIMITY